MVKKEDRTEIVYNLPRQYFISMLLHHTSNKSGLINNNKHRILIVSFFIFQLLFNSTLHAFEQLSINVEKINTKDWLLSDVSLFLSNIDKQTQQLVLSIEQLKFPQPFSQIKVVDVQCLEFNWQKNEIICQKGQAKLKSEYINPSFFSFSFSITDKQSQFNIENLRFEKGSLSLKAIEGGGEWAVTIKSKNIQLRTIRSFLAEAGNSIDELTSGNLNADIKANGDLDGIQNIRTKAQFNKVSLQAKKGNLATESLGFKIDLQAKLEKGVWYWNNNVNIQQGEFYIAPIYIETRGGQVNLNASGFMSEKGNIKIQNATLIHADVFELKAEGVMQIKPEFSIDRVQVSTYVEDLNKFSTLYLSPFFEQTPFEGIELKGSIKSEVELDKSKISQVSTDFKHFTVIDNKQRISISNAEGKVNWSVNPDFVLPSHVHWDKLKIKAIPIESGQLQFLFRQKNIKLLEPSSIPLLGGFMDIKQFNWFRATTDEPKVFFEGGIRELSLEQLTQAFGWTSLSGKLSGYIPGVDYENKTLKLKGELKVNVFDGVIKINKLASSGMFTDFSKFYMDMEIDNLDLSAITQKFKMGGIEGRVSGFVNNLYLENWQPVTFHAWLGTPDNDDSRHRISQKAVENIASIGGGGAADLISKGFLRFFDTFGYDSLGFGCYLHQGVCQLMGVEAAEKGYYIIKGGGLPRIDVIGYNPQLDWKVLMQRLSRIFESDKVLIN